jgi:hypothetical protein
MMSVVSAAHGVYSENRSLRVREEDFHSFVVNAFFMGVYL